MKKILLTIIALLCIVGSQAKGKDVVWEKTHSLDNISGVFLTVNKMEFKSAETVMHIGASYLPKYWIKFVKESVLKDQDGKEYAIISGEPTCEGESRMEIDSLFWMPESGEANLALHFQPLPKDTKRVDFIDGDKEGMLSIWNICSAEKPTPLPEEWRNLNYTANETLPNAKVGKGMATLKVRMIDCRPEMNSRLGIQHLKLQINGMPDKEIKFDDNGYIEVQLPTALACPIALGSRGIFFTFCIIAPGETVECLINPYAQDGEKCIFKGYMARTNTEYAKEWEKIDNEKFASKEFFSALQKCSTPDERFKVLTEEFNKAKEEINKRNDICDATKALLRMDVEGKYLRWIKNYAREYVVLYINMGNDKAPKSWDDYMAKMEKYKDDLNNIDYYPRKEEDFELFSAPYAPCSQTYWDQYPLVSYSLSDKSNFNLNILDNIYGTKLILENKSEDSEYYTTGITDPGCLALVEEYRQEMKRKKEQLDLSQNVYFHKLDSIAPEKFIDTILEKYKGKTVLVDVWATWCGPCRQGHIELAPLKEEFKDKDIAWVYISAPSSHVSQWQQMIIDIPGDHYFINKEQYDYIMDKLYESDGIPTYAIYNANGTMTFKNIGFPGRDKIRTELEKAMK